MPPSTMETAKLLSSVAYPLPRNRKLEEALLEACNLALETTYRGDEDWGRKRERPVFTSQLSIWPGQLATPILAWEFAASLSSRSLADSCLAPFIDLAKNVHLAILRESECWLSDRPQMAQFDLKERLHVERSAALAYRDGTRLYLNLGTVLPPEYVEHPEAIPLNVIDGLSAPYRREDLIELYGIERYLLARGATQEEASDGGILWLLKAGALGQIRIVEVPLAAGVGCQAERLFCSVADHVTTLAEALDFVQNSDVGSLWRVTGARAE